MIRARVLAVLSMAGCAGPVALSGTIEISPDDAGGLADAEVALHDEAFEVLGRTRTGSDGAFSIEAPRGAVIQLVVDDGVRPVAFQGEAGLDPEFVVPIGTLFALPDAWLDPFLAPFEACPDQGLGDGLVVGQTALDIAVDAGVDRPAEPCSFAFLESEDGTRIDACYLREVEEEPGTFAVDPEATLVGETGRFLFRGVSGGPWRMVVGRAVGCDATLASGTLIGESSVWVPEGGAVARLPALVPL